MAAIPCVVPVTRRNPSHLVRGKQPVNFADVQTAFSEQAIAKLIFFPSIEAASPEFSTIGRASHDHQFAVHQTN